MSPAPAPSLQAVTNPLCNVTTHRQVVYTHQIRYDTNMHSRPPPTEPCPLYLSSKHLASWMHLSWMHLAWMHHGCTYHPSTLHHGCNPSEKPHPSISLSSVACGSTDLTVKCPSCSSSLQVVHEALTIANKKMANPFLALQYK